MSNGALLSGPHGHMTDTKWVPAHSLHSCIAQFSNFCSREPKLRVYVIEYPILMEQVGLRIESPSRRAVRNRRVLLEEFRNFKIRISISYRMIDSKICRYCSRHFYMIDEYILLNDNPNDASHLTASFIDFHSRETSELFRTATQSSRVIQPPAWLLISEILF
jgi:hypothetical protein